jgi:signal transduction histidine kinase
MKRPVIRLGVSRLFPGRQALAQLAGYSEWAASAGLVGEPASRVFAPTRRVRLAVALLVGALLTAYVGYLTAGNPDAAPPHIAVAFRVVIMASLILAGVYASTISGQERMGRLLLATGFFSSLWLLNGSSSDLAFSVGVLCTGVALPAFYYLLLAHPRGRLHARRERLFMASAVLLAAGWAFCWLTTTQPPIAAPLLQCSPHCPHNAFFLGSTSATSSVRSLVLTAWVLTACGAFLLLAWRLRSASLPVRRSITPTTLVSMFSMLFLFGSLVSASTAARTPRVLGYLYVGTSVAIPLAIVVGLALERQFMGQALARFVDQLAAATPARLQQLMAEVLHDPTLTIAYPRPTRGTYVDSTGASVPMPVEDARQALAAIERDGAPVASVLYDTALADQEAFVRAAGAVAALRLQQAQLEADLKASMSDLAQSRRRLVDAADAERERIERDLHDGAQQHLVGLRVKLELATDAIKHDRERGERMLAEIGSDLDEALEELRALAHGVYPPLLSEHGLAEALKSTARSCPVPVSVHVGGIRRYRADLETAVYFCCREALQNVARHAGRDALTTIDLAEERSQLRFSVCDTGVGFTRSEQAPGSGIVNMRDRIEAVGGTLNVTSEPESGTVVSGCVPVALPPASAQPREHPRR